MLRFFVSSLNPKPISHQWVAETSLKLLEIFKDDDTIIIDPKNRLSKTQTPNQLPKDYLNKCKKLKRKCYSEAKKVIDSAKENLDSYLKTGNMEDLLIASSYALAKLDELKRAGYLSLPESFIAEKKDMEDLRQLISIINPKIFKAKHTCVLNPGFNPKISKLINADGDLVIDDTLIEIKTVKKFKVDRRNFDQLIGYYTLYRIGGIWGMSPDNKITKLGIYFSRHGYLHTYEIEDIIEESRYLEFVEWFKKRALEFGLS